MAVLLGLKCGAMAVQLVGTAIGLITKINQALETAGQNELEYEYLRSHLPTVCQAYDLVIDCEEQNSASQLYRASSHAEKLRSVNAMIDSQLILFILISSNAIIRRIGERDCCSCAGSAQKVKDVVVAERKIPEICPLSLPDCSSPRSTHKVAHEPIRRI